MGYKENKKEKRKRKKNMEFHATKVSFVAGIVLIITMLKVIAELFVEIPSPIVLGYSFFSSLIFFLVAGTKIFDKILTSKKVANFANFLTLFSVIFFVIENTIIKFREQLNTTEVTIMVIIWVFVGIACSINLLFGKY